MFSPPATWLKFDDARDLERDALLRRLVVATRRVWADDAEHLQDRGEPTGGGVELDAELQLAAAEVVRQVLPFGR
jgi:hypothetical protein